jgi:hypothetical protein
MARIDERLVSWFNASLVQTRQPKNAMSIYLAQEEKLDFRSFAFPIGKVACKGTFAFS